jgi:hypothetical protein
MIPERLEDLGTCDALRLRAAIKRPVFQKIPKKLARVVTVATSQNIAASAPERQTKPPPNFTRWADLITVLFRLKTVMQGVLNGTIGEPALLQTQIHAPGPRHSALRIRRS